LYFEIGSCYFESASFIIVQVILCLVKTVVTLYNIWWHHRRALASIYNPVLDFSALLPNAAGATFSFEGEETLELRARRIERRKETRYPITMNG
jgi:hypothetical protein